MIPETRVDEVDARTVKGIGSAAVDVVAVESDADIGVDVGVGANDDSGLDVFRFEPNALNLFEPLDDKEPFLVGNVLLCR